MRSKDDDERVPAQGAGVSMASGSQRVVLFVRRGRCPGVSRQTPCPCCHGRLAASAVAAEAPPPSAAGSSTNNAARGNAYEGKLPRSSITLRLRRAKQDKRELQARNAAAAAAAAEEAAAVFAEEQLLGDTGLNFRQLRALGLPRNDWCL